MRSSIPVTLSFVVLAAFATSASASSGEAVHGRGFHAEAALFARVLGDDHRPIQILDQLCRNPDAQRRCSAIRPALERAITKAVERPIVWVHHVRRHAGVFWILAPVRFGSATARIRSAWRDPRPYGCTGGGQLRYQHVHGTWKLVWGIGYEGCSASA